MDGHAFWRWVHVLVFVFWLGADIGVFICGRWIRRADLSLAERMMLLKAASAIDLWPRVSAALMLPVGVTLASAWLPAVTGVWIAAAWGAAVCWLALMVAGLRTFGTPTGARVSAVTNVFLAVLGLVCLTAGVAAMRTYGGVGWVGAKLALYGVVCGLAIGIDKAFGPVVAGFGLLASAGREQEGHEVIVRGMNRTLVVVATLYAVLLLASALGVGKPG